MTDIHSLSASRFRSHPLASWRKKEKKKERRKINKNAKREEKEKWILVEFTEPSRAGFNYSTPGWDNRRPRRKGDAYAVGTRDELRNYRDAGPRYHFHQRYHAATATPARGKGGGEKEARNAGGDALIDCTFHCSYGPFRAYALARVLPRRWKREIATTRHREKGHRSWRSFLSFSLSSVPCTPPRRRKLRRVATPFFLAFCPPRGRARGENLRPCFSFFRSTLLQLGVITRARARVSSRSEGPREFKSFSRRGSPFEPRSKRGTR